MNIVQRHWVGTILIFVFPLFIAGYIFQNGRNVPFWDQWDTSIPIAVATADGELSLQDIVQQHNEHRIVFTNLTTALFTYTTNWNLKMEMSISWLLTGFNFLLIIALYGQSAFKIPTFLPISFSALLFSLRQSENWLWSFQTSWYFFCFFLLIVLVVLKYFPISWKTLIAAAFLTLCAMFSLGAGIISWFMIGVAMWGLGYRKVNYYLLWVSVAVLSYVLYFIILDYQASVTPQTYNPVLLSSFLFIFLGGAFIHHQWIAFFVGNIGIILLIINTRYLYIMKYKWSQLTVWLTLSAIAISAGTLAGVSRLYLGVGGARAPRYSTIANLFWVALLVLGYWVVSDIYHKKHRQKWLMYINLLTFAAVLSIYVFGSIRTLQGRGYVTVEHEDCLEAAPISQNVYCLKDIASPLVHDQENEVYHDIILERANDLATRNLSIFGS